MHIIHIHTQRDVRIPHDHSVKRGEILHHVQMMNLDLMHPHYLIEIYTYEMDPINFFEDLNFV